MCWRLKLDALEVDFGIDYFHRYVEFLVVLKEYDESPAVHQLVSFLCSSFLAMAREGLTIAMLYAEHGAKGICGALGAVGILKLDPGFSYCQQLLNQRHGNGIGA